MRLYCVMLQHSVRIILSKVTNLYDGILFRIGNNNSSQSDKIKEDQLFHK